jgi:thiamine pyrophosphokinase
VLVICAEGDQFDHEIATLIAAASSSACPTIAFRRGLCLPLSPQTPVTCVLEPGARVSLLPILPCTGVLLSGVQWPLSDASLEAGGLISISNKATGMVGASIDSGRASLFVEVPIGTWPSEVARVSR